VRPQPRVYNSGVPEHATGFALRRVRDPLEQHRLAGEFAAVVSRLARDGKEVVLLPFSSHPSAAGEQDIAYAREIRERAPAPSLRIIEPGGPWQMLDVVGRLDRIVAMRFHAIAFAQAARTPVLALPYDDKCASFAAEHGVPALTLPHLTADGLLASLSLTKRAVAA
jgi:polysaccharide pyruvyl transferase WcaK-like protein